ncbi:MAG: PDZ domain-containing protein [Verrucomicrobiota bacterium]
MKTAAPWLFALSFVGAVWCPGAEPPSPGTPQEFQRADTPLRSAPPRSWLGFEVSKPDATITSQLPDLPAGIGFLVNSVATGGPADEAGLKEFDLVWKFADQLLVNEGQLAALLRLRQPGEKIDISIFRGGKSSLVSLTLGETPIPATPTLVQAAENSMFAADRGPVRIVNFSEKFASYSNDEGRAEVKKEGPGYHIRIVKADGTTLYEGALNTPDDFQELPKEWKRRASALRRGLDQALTGPVMPPRPAPARVAAPARPAVR